LSIQTIFCPQCRQDMPHVRARAGIIMCTICRWQRPWNTTGWAEGSLAVPSPAWLGSGWVNGWVSGTVTPIRHNVTTHTRKAEITDAD
jgi:hypothetical protein